MTDPFDLARRLVHEAYGTLAAAIAALELSELAELDTEQEQNR